MRVLFAANYVSVWVSTQNVLWPSPACLITGPGPRIGSETVVLGSKKVVVPWLSCRFEQSPQSRAGPAFRWGVGCKLCSFAAAAAGAAKTSRQATSKVSTVWSRFEVVSPNSVNAWAIRQHALQNVHKRAVQSWLFQQQPEARAAGLQLIMLRKSPLSGIKLH